MSDGPAAMSPILRNGAGRESNSAAFQKMNMQVLLQLRRTGVFQQPASLCLLGEASEVSAIHDLGEARVDNRKISKMGQNHAKTLRCKRCLVLAAPWI